MTKAEITMVLVGGSEADYHQLRDLLADFNDGCHRLTWSPSYEAGLANALKNQPHVFIVNYRLDDHNAVDFITDIRKNSCVKPVILLLDQADGAEAERAAIKVGAEAYLYKHVDHPDEISGAIYDSIERFEALEAIRRSERRLRGIFYWSSIGISLIDLDRLIVQNNPAFCNIVGFDNEQLCAMDIADDFAHPDDLTNVREAFERLAAGNYPVSRIQSRFQRKDRKWVWVELTMSLFSETDAKPQFVICLTEDITDKKNTQMALEHSEAELKQLSAQLISVQEKEQRRVSFELHDSIGGNLAGIKYMLEKIKIKLDDACSELRETIDQAEARVAETMDEVQRISAKLHPPILDDLGLIATLKWLCRNHNSIYAGIVAVLKADVEESTIPPELKTTIFRLVQEAMTNAAKHSRGSRIDVRLKKREGQLVLSVSDNGRGFSSKPIRDLQDPKGMGLRNMIKRTELSGGMMAIKPKRNEGTRVIAKWPVFRP